MSEFRHRLTNRADIRAPKSTHEPITRYHSEMTTARLAFAVTPSGWKELQARMCQLFLEMGWEAREAVVTPLARGRKELDVHVVDNLVVPKQVYAGECKNWSSRVTQEIVHSFRTVCSDLGVTIGFLVSKNGFQSGAHEAAVMSNVRLLTFEELQQQFFQRWYEAMLLWLKPRLDILFPYWDPTGGRMPKKPWSEAERERHRALPHSFNKPTIGVGRIEVTSYRQYFELVEQSYSVMLSKMRTLHGEDR